MVMTMSNCPACPGCDSSCGFVGEIYTAEEYAAVIDYIDWREGHPFGTLTDSTTIGVDHTLYNAILGDALDRGLVEFDGDTFSWRLL